MAFTVTFPTTGDPPDCATLTGWLADQGEPCEPEGPSCIHLRAMPIHLRIPSSGHVHAQLEITAVVNLSRLVNLLFELSVTLGADVRLAGLGEVSRAELWLCLADEQDRIRIIEAVQRADEHGHRSDLLRKLWRIISALRPHHDVRWDAEKGRIVEMHEVGTADGISVEDASWHADNPSSGDLVGVPVRGYLHSLAWRWLSEAYPGIAENPLLSSTR